jgi:hypothetical protein
MRAAQNMSAGRDLRTLRYRVSNKLGRVWSLLNTTILLQTHGVTSHIIKHYFYFIKTGET